MRARSLSPRAIRFGHFVADLRAGELRRDGAKIKLQEQPFKILAMLLERSGDVVTREEMQKKLWPGDTFVDFDHGINMAVAKIREVLADPSEQPRYIETVGKRGYRFLAAVVTPEEEAGLASAAFPFRQGRAAKRHSVGRENELSELKEGFRCVEDGKGLLLCVAGEAGIGKTTLVEDFLADLVLAGKRWTIGRGKCSERLAGAEAYLPVLEALESMCHGKAGGGVTRVMRRLAPTWYGQIVPRAGGSSGDEAANPETRATSQERLKRELFRFLRELSQTRPLVLFLDDMQWADISTVDLLAYIGGKFHATRVLIVVTYRPSELLPAKHPFLQVRLDLQMRGVCRELEVEFLSRKDIESYLEIEFSGHRFPTEFPALIHAKTEGNALYMVDVLRYLRTRKVVAKKDGSGSL